VAGKLPVEIKDFFEYFADLDLEIISRMNFHLVVMCHSFSMIITL